MRSVLSAPVQLPLSCNDVFTPPCESESPEVAGRMEMAQAAAVSIYDSQCTCFTSLRAYATPNVTQNEQNQPLPLFFPETLNSTKRNPYQEFDDLIDSAKTESRFGSVGVDLMGFKKTWVDLDEF